MSIPSFFGRSLMWPLEATTSNPDPRYFLIVLAFAGDSTTTSVFAISRFSLPNFPAILSDCERLLDERSPEGPLLLRSPRQASRARRWPLGGSAPHAEPA